MASAGSGDKKAIVVTIMLISSDNKRFEVAEVAATQSQTIRHMIEDGVKLPNVTGKVLAKVLEYCNEHGPTSSAEAAETFSSPDAVASTTRRRPPAEGPSDELQRGIHRRQPDYIVYKNLTTNYLDIKGLVDITCQKVADMKPLVQVCMPL
jgi:S-phase kinase-associated protein 1